MVEYTFWKKLILIKQTNQKNVIFVTIDISYIKILIMKKLDAMAAMV